MELQVRRALLYAFVIGALLGAAGWLLLNGDASTTAEGVRACFPPNHTYCPDCTAV